MLYALLFLVAGSALLALTYGLLASRLPAARSRPKNVAQPSAQLLALCKQQPAPGKTAAGKTATDKSAAKTVPDSVLEKCKAAYAAGASAASQGQRDATLNSLLISSLIGLGITTLSSAGLGWILSGRALRPVRAITETARRASELQLGDRIALVGPDDELKELADTFDQMLERLDAAFASQKRFVANAAHELRTPLTAMRTAIEVTLSKPARTPEQLETMAVKVRTSIQRAQATIDALLTLASSERGPTIREPVDLATATEDALDIASATIAERELEVETALAPACTTGDRVLLERMIANLVDNAIRHNNPNGRIELRTGEFAGQAFVEIANTGPEVPNETIPFLLEPFGRAEQRLNPNEGVGLGLSIANTIAAVHGATLTAKSRPGGGLSISIALPGSSESSGPTETRRESDSRCGSADQRVRRQADSDAGAI